MEICFSVYFLDRIGEVIVTDKPETKKPSSPWENKNNDKTLLSLSKWGEAAKKELSKCIFS